MPADPWENVRTLRDYWTTTLRLGRLVRGKVGQTAGMLEEPCKIHKQEGWLQ